MTLYEEALHCAVHMGQCEGCGAEYSLLLGGLCPTCAERRRLATWQDNLPLGQWKQRHAREAGLIVARCLAA